MLTAKDLLITQTAAAFRGRADMPLMASLERITREEAWWRIDEATPTIEQIVRHIAWAKSRYCQQAFGTPMVLDDDSVDGEGDCATLPTNFPAAAHGGNRAYHPASPERSQLLEQSHQVLTHGILHG